MKSIKGLVLLDVTFLRESNVGISKRIQVKRLHLSRIININT